jgi:hypothetical protein
MNQKNKYTNMKYKYDFTKATYELRQSVIRVFNKRENECLKAAQIKYRRPLLRFTEVDHKECRYKGNSLV